MNIERFCRGLREGLYAVAMVRLHHKSVHNCRVTAECFACVETGNVRVRMRNYYPGLESQTLWLDVSPDEDLACARAGGRVGAWADELADAILKIELATRSSDQNVYTVPA